MERDIGDLIKTLQPTQGLFTPATAMFRHAWNLRRDQATGVVQSGKRKVKDIEKQTDTLLTRIMDSTNTIRDRHV
ncbi:MAG: hypothetical protein JKX69_13215 [Rhodobacteraceae bacterium]|nr:hypothetical protein [Paracoccaceae bacterium]